jgi:MoaA/NifB/PqqE/SkfB family radical SAM enzyme
MDFGADPLLQFATPLPGTELESKCRAEDLLAERPVDPYQGFQHRSFVTTEDFEPSFLRQSATMFHRALGGAQERKVIVNLTYRCNNHCVFCATGDRPALDADPKKVNRDLRRHRRAGFDLLDIDGGEPTLHPDLFKVVRLARTLEFQRITVTTNARRLAYPAFARQLAQSGIHELLVSLHAADEKRHEELTQVPGSYSQTLAGLKNALQAFDGRDAVAVNTTLVASNYSSCRALGALLAGLGVRRWNLQVVTPFGRARPAHLPPADSLRAVLADLLSRPPGAMQIQVVNWQPCQLPGFEAQLAEDFAKAERRMVFVGDAGINLQGFLSSRRVVDRKCRACVYSLVCPGRYDFALRAEDRIGVNSSPPKRSR